MAIVLRKKKKTARVKKKPAVRLPTKGTDSFRKLLDEIEQLKTQNDYLRAAEQEWEDSFRWYFELYENAPAAIFVFDANGIVTDCNQAGAGLLNLEVRRITGLPFARFLESDAVARFDELLRRTIESGRRQTGEFGLAAPKRRLIQMQSDPLPRRRGISRCRAVALDITGRVFAEAAADDARIFAESILATIREPIVVLDEQMRFVYSNAAFSEFFAIGAQSLDGASFFAFDKGVWNSPGLYERFAEVIKKNGPPLELFEIERDFPRVGHKWLRLSALLMKQEKGRNPRLLAAMHDITSLRREEALEALTGELDSFNYTVSHDLRSPLHVITGCTAVLQEKFNDDTDGDKKYLLDAITHNAEKMGDMIGSLLNLSRLGRAELRKTRVDMTRMAREAFEEAREEARGRDIEFKAGPMPDAPADAALARHVWMNLLSNAIKFTATRDRAVIETGGRIEGGFAVYYVKDNGVGFNPAQADQLFVPFRRLHAEKDFKGTGVGLTIAHRIVSRHGGRIWAEGRAGEGACFHFSLPAEGE